MNSYYPLNILLTGKRVTVIGGGAVAERKLAGLIDLGADLWVISPTITESIRKWKEEGKLTWKKERFQASFVTDSFLIISATDDDQITADLKAHLAPHQLVNFADDFESSSVILPAVVRRGGLLLSVSTSGASPTLAGKIKRELEVMYDEEYEEYIDFLYEARKMILQSDLNRSNRKELLKKLIHDPLFRGPQRNYRLRELIGENIGQKE